MYAQDERTQSDQHHRRRYEVTVKESPGRQFSLTRHSIPVQSPTLTYWPWREGGLASGSVPYGWATYYGSSGYLNANGGLPRGDVPSGTSYHVSAFNGASVSLQFRGSAVYVLGTSNCTYDVTFNGQTLTTTVAAGQTVGNTLAVFQQLKRGTHSITLTVRSGNPSHMLLLDQVVVTMNLSLASVRLASFASLH